MKRFAADGAEAVQITSAEAARFYLSELEKWSKVVKAPNIKAE